MLKEITVEQLLNLEKVIPVDVRSPVEYQDGSIPGSFNLPLFSDDERAEVGTIYKHKGQDSAKWKAMEIVSPKIPMLLKEIKKLHENGFIPVIFCWRGGLRSKSVCTFMEFAGLSSLRLTGGYKAYRQFILDKYSEMLPQQAIVIHGKTGVGKTEILHRLRTKGYPVLDIEAIAGHRGSIFGSIGIGEGHNQKTFDALLFSALKEIKDYPYFIMEAESKRIGRAVQPIDLLERKENGQHFYLEATLDRRIEHIMNEYVQPFSNEPWFKEKIQLGLNKIEKRLNNICVREELQQSYLNEDWFSMIRILLEDYYDPRYDFKRSEYNGSFEMIDAESIEYAVNEIEAKLENIKTAV